MMDAGSPSLRNVELDEWLTFDDDVQLPVVGERLIGAVLGCWLDVPGRTYHRRHTAVSGKVASSPAGSAGKLALEIPGARLVLRTTVNRPNLFELIGQTVTLDVAIFVLPSYDAEGFPEFATDWMIHRSEFDEDRRYVLEVSPVAAS